MGIDVNLIAFKVYKTDHYFNSAKKMVVSIKSLLPLNEFSMRKAKLLTAHHRYFSILPRGKDIALTKYSEII